MRTSIHCDRRGMGPRLWFGLILLALGILWTLDNLRYVEAGRVLEWWPLVFVALGLSKFTGWGGRQARPMGGLVWIAIGGFLLAHELDVIPWGMHDLWPIGLVFLGALLVWKSVRGRDPGSTRVMGPVTVLDDDGTKRETTTEGAFDTATFSAVAVFAGVVRKPTSQAFRGGDFTAIMGGGEINLRDAKPIPGGCVIELAVVMGGLEIKVPENWTVVNEVFAFMGGIDDARKGAAVDSSHTLVLKGFAVMGGVEIKN